LKVDSIDFGSGGEIKDMDNDSFKSGHGAIITLADLETKLLWISQGEHHWKSRLARIAGESQMACAQQRIEIWYNNPEFINLPNQICFRFPAFPQALGRKSETLVCLHPSLPELAVAGLYFEGDMLKQDCLGDWYRFWPPLWGLLFPVMHSSADQE
jgi:hypothetical protein